jgi:hypothetical protein
MLVIESSKRSDTMIFSHEKENLWKIIRWNSDAEPLQPVRGVRIDRNGDSLRVSMNYGRSGEEYYGIKE